MSDPFRQNTPSASDDELTGLAENGPVSRGLGRGLIFEESQVTDRVGGFIVSDDRRSNDDHMAAVFGEEYRNELSPDEANAQFWIEGMPRFDRPVNAHRAAEMNRQANLKRYREETASRAPLSTADRMGAGILGSALDPVMLPTWFIGGGGAAIRAMRLAPAATRLGGAARGAAVGMIDGLTSGVVAEGISAGARASAGEDFDIGASANTILFGVGLGATIGGGVGGSTRPAGRAAPTARAGAIGELIAQAAAAKGEDAATAMRIAEIESRFNARARNPRSSAGGLFQFIDDTWNGMGGGDKFDARLNAERGVELLSRNRAHLRRELGREPQPWELYLAHQQGAGGASAILSDPNRPAVDALRAAGATNPARALSLNGGHAGMTAGQFATKWRDKFGGGMSLEALTPPRPPRALAGLTENERMGAFAEALEAVAEDAPLDLGTVLARNGLDALDEASAVPSIRGRWLEPDVAILRTGGEVPVRFAVVEMADLVTSHSDDLTPEAAYPQALQPRDRSRAGSQAGNYELERDLNPALLMRDKAASAGAPIVSPSGLVESGNGRTIALRRSAATGTEAWGRYRAQLEREGIDVSGFDRPVLVRMRSEPMTGAARADMARDMNLSQTEGFSPVEQAKSDARRLDRATLDLLDGDDPFAAGNRPFLRGFVGRVAPGDANALTDAKGAISLNGKARVQAALVQAAYGDEALTAALFENADDTIRSIGQALADAAPAWARMRTTAAPQMDLTGHLTSAVAMVREARNSRTPVAALLDGRLGQGDMFGGEAVSPETEALVRLMFRDEALTKPRAVEKIAGALKAYAREAGDVPAGPDLFGETPDAHAFLKTLIAKYGDAEGEGRTGLAWAGGSEPLWSTRELSGGTAESAGLDLRGPEPDDGGPGGGRGGGKDGDSAGPGGGGDGDGRPDVAGFKIEWGDDPADPQFWVQADDVLTTKEGLDTNDYIFGHVTASELRVHRSQLKDAAQGKGLGVKMYEYAAQEAARTGRAFVSDQQVSQSAQRVWEALKRRGYAVLQNPAAVTSKGFLNSPDTSPVFRIEAPKANTAARPTAESRVAAIIAADPELKALMDDTEALAQAAGVDLPAFDPSTEPSTVAEAIRAAAFCLASDIDVSRVIR